MIRYELRLCAGVHYDHYTIDSFIIDFGNDYSSAYAMHNVCKNILKSNDWKKILSFFNTHFTNEAFACRSDQTPLHFEYQGLWKIEQTQLCRY